MDMPLWQQVNGVNVNGVNAVGHYPSSKKSAAKKSADGDDDIMEGLELAVQRSSKSTGCGTKLVTSPGIWQSQDVSEDEGSCCSAPLPSLIFLILPRSSVCTSCVSQDAWVGVACHERLVREWRPHVLQQEIIPTGILSDHFPIRLELDLSENLDGSPDASQFFRVNLDTLDDPACREGLAKIWDLWSADTGEHNGLDQITRALAESKAFLRSFGKLQARGRRARISRLRAKVRKYVLAAERDAGTWPFSMSLRRPAVS